MTFRGGLVFILLLCSGCHHHKVVQNKIDTAQLENELDFFSSPVVKKSTKDKVKKILPKYPQNFYLPISLSITNQIPIRNLLSMIAQQVNLNVIIADNVQGEAILNVNQQPAFSIIQQICLTNKLRYYVKNNIINIEKDEAYFHNYKLSFLSFVRSNENNLSIDTDIFTNTNGVNNNNGSSTKLITNSKSDFWKELEENINMIINCHDKNSKVSINKQGGIIAVFAPQKIQQQIQKYLSMLQKSITKQVLIEAKIIEIHLNENFKTGINWNYLSKNMLIGSTLGSAKTISPLNLSSENLPASTFFLSKNNANIRSIFTMLKTFGSVKAISNPRLTVLNNNSAVLKVANNHVYFRLNYVKNYNKVTGSSNEVIENGHWSSEIKTVPIGFMMLFILLFVMMGG